MEAAGEYPAEINMGVTEILLIVLGVVAFVGSFIIPEAMEKGNLKDIKTIEENIKELVQKEVKQASFQIEEKIEETVSATADKSERYMERLSNEKIMAIQEYSDTVLSQINKNHEEAVFLYDMLNNKHTQIKNTVAEFNIKIQDATVKYEMTSQEQMPEGTTESILNSTEIENSSIDEKILGEDTLESENEVGKENELHIDEKLEAGKHKSNILKLHEQGVSTVVIAKSLGLGIGEVKLIIDLYENGK